MDWKKCGRDIDREKVWMRRRCRCKMKFKISVYKTVSLWNAIKNVSRTKDVG